MPLLFFTPEFQHAGQVFDGGIALMTLDDAAKGLPGHKVHDLREQGFACIHGHLQVIEPLEHA